VSLKLSEERGLKPFGVGVGSAAKTGGVRKKVKVKSKKTIINIRLAISDFKAGIFLGYFISPFSATVISRQTK
jgi:hypothetical protein